jgi:hypothetical protein
LKKDVEKDLIFHVIFWISHDWPGAPFFFNNEVQAACCGLGIKPITAGGAAPQIPADFIFRQDRKVSTRLR